jgi:predicted HNH restriction endonuclease
MSKKGGKSYLDDEQRREYDREWYARRSEGEKKRIRSVKYDRVKRIRHQFREYKKSLSCERCGFSHPAAIQFHHRDPKMKDFDVGNAAKSGLSFERILAEIAKCEVLCANCHAIEHWDDDGV